MTRACRRFSRTLALALLGAALAASSAPAAEVYAAPDAVRPLLVGSEVPSAAVQRLDGSEVDLRDVVGKKKAVVIFYRGGW
ncbi:MAG: hypothetical protein OES32_07690 [Acidobacteriota bacterium]|nr:hypothetical protein [Acidobacteriota bacterium]MDH3523455.1 hypothetical protein [Acidobacteriota bacterium]